MLIRRLKVLRYKLRGLTPDEMLRLPDFEGVSRATIFRDLAALNVELAEKIEAHKLYTVKTAFAELAEVYREYWLLYHRPPPATDRRPVDDRRTKAVLLNQIVNIISLRSRLAGYLVEAHPRPEQTMQSTFSDDELIQKVKAMKPEEENIIIEAIKLLGPNPRS